MSKPAGGSINKTKSTKNTIRIVDEKKPPEEDNDGIPIQQIQQWVKEEEFSADTEKKIQEESEVKVAGGYGVFGWIVIIGAYLTVVLTFPISIAFTSAVIKEHERAVVLRFGRRRHKGVVGPGLVFKIPFIDDIIRVDHRMISHHVSPQKILTRDSIPITIEVVTHYRIVDAVKSVANVDNPYKTTNLLALTSVRHVVARKTVNDVITNRNAINVEIKERLQHMTEKWAIQVEQVDIKNLHLSVELQKALNLEAEAVAEAKTKLKSAEGEQQASLVLAKAAEVLSASPVALQLRYMETLNDIAYQKNSTIVFPVPVDVMPSMNASINGQR